MFCFHRHRPGDFILPLPHFTLSLLSWVYFLPVVGTSAQMPIMSLLALTDPQIFSGFTFSPQAPIFSSAGVPTGPSSSCTYTHANWISGFAVLPFAPPHPTVPLARCTAPKFRARFPGTKQEEERRKKNQNNFGSKQQLRRRREGKAGWIQVGGPPVPPV